MNDKAKLKADRTYQKLIVQVAEPTVRNDTQAVLAAHPQVVRDIYRTFIDPNPTCGWVPMLSEILRRIAQVKPQSSR